MSIAYNKRFKTKLNFVALNPTQTASYGHKHGKYLNVSLVDCFFFFLSLPRNFHKDVL